MLHAGSLPLTQKCDKIMNNILKLTSAVYKILEYFPESDPLKNRAKEKALDVMSRISGIPPVAGENTIQEDIKILLGYLEVAKSQGWMSSANYIIISNEFEKIKKEICGKEPIWETPFDRPQVFPSRQGKILEFLNKNQKAQVVDLQVILPDVTKRTIRRDLDELLVSGKIVRMGEFNEVFYRIKG